jgi:hypothetical protein
MVDPIRRRFQHKCVRVREQGLRLAKIFVAAGTVGLASQIHFRSRRPDRARECVPVKQNHLLGVMAGLVPAIHVFCAEGLQEDVDAREDGVPAA